MNDELSGFSDETLNYAERFLHRYAIRALFLSHDNPARLRVAWDTMVAEMWRDQAALYGLSEQRQVSNFADALHIAQEMLQLHLPQSNGGRSPPA